MTSPTGSAIGAPRRPVVVDMRPRHLRGVVAIESATNPRPWSHALFESELKQAASRCFVAVGSQAAVEGFGCMMSTGFEAHVTNLATAPACRRRGVASRLLLRLVDEALDRGLDAVTLEVRESNAGAQALYRRFGFEVDGVRPGYYAESHEDALIMWARDIAGADYQRRIDRIVADLAHRDGR